MPFYCLQSVSADCQAQSRRYILKVAIFGFHHLGVPEIADSKSQQNGFESLPNAEAASLGGLQETVLLHRPTCAE